VNDIALFRLSARVGVALARARLRAATAESCTAGWIAKALTDVPGSSQWFDSGFVTYSNQAKRRDLGVTLRTLARYGAVSEQAVREMARGALKRSGADLAIAVTGIAGPDGGSPHKPVGTVWFCLGMRRRGGADRGANALTTARKQFNGDREAIRRKSVAYALRLMLRGLVRRDGRGSRSARAAA